MEKKIKKILITGAGGFMGSCAIKYFKQKGYYVRAVDKEFRKERQELYNYADQIMYFDLRDLRSCLLATEDVDWVIHFASDMGGVGYFSAHDYEPYINNMRMDMNMLKSCEYNKVSRLYYSSSACIYPTHMQMVEGQSPKLAEDMIYPANSDLMYGWEKLMMTMLCERSPLDARVGIQHTVYGPYQETEGEKRKFPTAIAVKAIQAKKDGKAIEIWGNGKQERTFTYIDDALKKIDLIMTTEKYNGPVNVGDERVVSVEQVAKICCYLTGAKPKFNFTKDKPSGVLARGCDNSKFKDLYHFENKVSLEEGFQKLITWIKKNDKAS